MSPVFRHGRLRLYLLKLLDEAPRHGYEVIRLLQDRFMGVYAPSPGTIYPRLARLEEDGLVTHEEVNGKKVYSITDKGREEIRSRLSDLADLEDELTESLRDVAREISVDVRDTVRSIREQVASAAREFRAQDSNPGRPKTADSAPHPDAGEPDGAADSRTGREHEREDARRIRDEAQRTREQMRSGFGAKGRGPLGADWAAWSAWSEEAGDQPGPFGTAGAGGGARGQGSRRGGPSPFNDLERMAIQFATELRATARQTGNVGERSLSDLRDILTDTLARVRDEVFGTGGRQAEHRPAAEATSSETTGTGAAASGPSDSTSADGTGADSRPAD